ncbi:MAG: Rieske 2Fe-2S domain-containing protein [Hydrogenophaga sp.]|uniref:aromatic ring-hydroxylating oxygenase subunit alpha n=1 Tax=Hydrogenophaga sp. TaxID=1904254 RepID=UPI00169D4EE8|nr:aromatic ring-hydroxylating dioxygenase subunit alpha [Hydrogenophaga sp.]NIM41859.1 Rieske 2Fe-2S domain-containing protein [Hydrogenophaga sp.]NIN27164.1 Rieske 2Fe-2S domain-containing protein [Hydrogenophaga sp.]NIN31865.1 Rieske 2Fe-2S domain-containing protein [Hydrogenophaga sp.]NIN56109.1 Rieske 2Fe-2S domain-containing protein [Hydrogenophaga sp.]NIO52236.1 Rieske 2Fe-2S domain-containing protein [Hydrogenophaga sp.]
MSDLSLQLQQAKSQFPVSSYFDQALFQRELETIFQRGPRYVGHALSVPNIGDYHALPQEGEGRALVRTPSGVELISNVCRHRQAVMLKGRGNLQGHSPGHAGGNIVCPLHRWTYSGTNTPAGGGPAGQLLGAPHFQQDPCLNLNNYRLREWNGLLFEDNGRDIAADLAGMGPREILSFEGMVLDHVEMHECNYNWKTFIEVYLEDYHVGPFHPGLGNFVTCEDLRWEFRPEYSVQTVGAQNLLEKAGSPTYQRWHEVLMAYRQGELPAHGAVWLTYYPHIMVEWYPHVLTVSTLHPISVDKTLNMVEFYYPEEIAAFEREFVEAQRAAYMETCIEDDEIAERMDAGRKALLARGDNEVGPYQSPMEDGMQHFHEWYRQKMGAAFTD